MTMKNITRQTLENLEVEKKLEKEAEEFKNEALEKTEEAGMGNLFVNGVKDIVKTQD